MARLNKRSQGSSNNKRSS